MQNKIAVSLLLVLIILGSTAAIAANDVDINWSVVAGGGGRATAGILSLDNTVGQAAIGLASNGSTQLCAGFWCMQEAPRSVSVYLPLLLHRSTH